MPARIDPPLRIGYLMQAGVPDIRSRPLSGPANHVKHVFRELHNLGHQVRLLFYMNGRIWKSDDLQSFEPVIISALEEGLVRSFESGVRRIQYELQLPYVALFESIRFASACRKVLYDYDLFYERMGWMGYAGALASRWMRKPLVLEVNGDHLAEMKLQGNAPKGLQRRLSLALTRFAARQAGHSVATGESWRQRFIEQWNVAPEKVTVIENGSELVELIARNTLQVFCHGANRHHEVRIAYVGGFEPWHGVQVLVHAVARAVAQGLDIHLLLIGSGSEESGIKELVYDSGLEERVTFTGHVCAAELANYLRNAQIAVSPYCGRDEYSGLKLLDYKAAGLATIASGVSGEPKVIEHGRNGWIVPPCDEIALCEAIVLLATDSGLRSRLGQVARLEAETKHSWQNTVLQLNELFENLVSA